MPKDWVPDVDIDLHINMTVAVSRYFPEPLLSIIQELILHRPNQQLRTMGHCMQYKYSVDLATVLLRVSTYSGYPTSCNTL